MDTLKSGSTETRFSWLRNWRVLLFLGLILLVQGTLAYLVTWIDPPRSPAFVSIRIAEYQSRPLAHLGTRGGDSTFADTPNVGTSRTQIQKALDELEGRDHSEPVVVYLSGLALQAEEGNVYLLPSDASPDDPATWLRLREVLAKLQACPARQKLLVLDLTPAPPALGSLYHDLAAALPRELENVPDADRLVLCASSAGQPSHLSGELGQSVFAHYFHEALVGHADGYGDLRDGRITVKELTAFVQARVERWTWRNRGARQRPMLLGTGRDFTLTTVDLAAPRETAPIPAARTYPDWLLDAWKARDAAYQSGRYRLAPRLFQQQQALLLALEQAWRAGDSEQALKKQWLPECERLQEALLRIAKDVDAAATQRNPAFDAVKKSFDEPWQALQQQIAGVKPAEAERLKTRFLDDLRGRLSTSDLDAVVFAQALANPRLDPGTVRLYDRLLHSTPPASPRTPETLRVRQLADLAMRVELAAWPHELVEMLLRCTQIGETSLRQTPYLPGYTALLEEPALARHAGEVRSWTCGYSSLDEAKERLSTASAQFVRLAKLNEKWRQCESILDEALAELPWYVAALESMPEQRTSWEQAIAAARSLAATLSDSTDSRQSWLERVARLTTQVERAELHAQILQQHRHALHAAFARDTIARLERQCRSSSSDAATGQAAEALLRVAAPVLPAEDRAALWKSLNILSRRLHEEVIAQDRQDNEAQRLTPSLEIKSAPVEDEPARAELRGRTQLALLELADVAEDRLRPMRQSLERCKNGINNPAAWCKLGLALRRIMSEQMPRQYQQATGWRERERLAWVMPPLDHFTGVDGVETSPTVQQRRRQNERHERWLAEHHRYLARDYLGLNFESPGIVAARSFYTRAAGDHAFKPTPEAYVRLNVPYSVEPLTEKRPYAHVLLEVTRHLPPGAFGPVELQFQRTDNVWLEVAPGSGSLPALLEWKDPRTLTHKIPLKAIRRAKAERTGLPPPLGFLVEARFEGRSYHHLVTVPIVPNTQEVQILVSADPLEPATTLNAIRVRPGKVKQPHYVYVKNLTNRTQKVHVEVTVDGALFHKSRQPLTLEPDGVRKVLFDESSATAATPLRGTLAVRVLDQDRQKVLQEKSLHVDILSPQDYVKVADVSYEPGRQGNNRWAVQVQASRSVVGPAIAAQLVLPMQRIPGLLGIGGGTLRAELPTQGTTPNTLFAEKIRLVHAAAEEGPVYLHIDGVPRAFVYRTTFSRDGEPTQPLPDDRPAVRLLAPQCIMAGINCLVDVEVDNAPKGSKLEIALGQTAPDGSFQAEIVREFADAKKRRIDLETSKDALILAASISDWTATFDTRSIVGARALQVRLLDAGGKVLASAGQPLIIDDSPPLARFTPTVAAVKKGSLLQVQALGADPESGVARVVFFFGRPDKGEIPMGASRIKAIPASRDQSLWTAALLVPADQKGPLTLSVHVLNHAGLTTIDTITLEVTDREPGKTGLGKIHGRVVEGPRPQPNLTVTLTDERGQEITRTQTQADGTYRFEQIAPGRYRVQCVKPESQRRAVLSVIVEPDQQTRVDLALAL